MAKQGKVLTGNQKEYKILEQKLKRRIRELGKRGYTFGEIPNPEKITKRAINKLKEVTENIYKYAKYYDPLQDRYISGTERLKQERAIAARKGWETRRRKQALEYYDAHRLDDAKSFADLVENRRNERDNLPSEEEAILREVLYIIETWQPDPRWTAEFVEIKREDKNMLENVINGAINSAGWNQVCRNLKGQTSYFYMLCQQILYESGNKYKQAGREAVRIALNEIAQIIWGRALTVQEAQDIEDFGTAFNEYE